MAKVEGPIDVAHDQLCLTLVPIRHSLSKFIERELSNLFLYIIIKLNFSNKRQSIVSQEKKKDLAKGNIINQYSENDV